MTSAPEQLQHWAHTGDAASLRALCDIANSVDDPLHAQALHILRRHRSPQLPAIARTYIVHAHPSCALWAIDCVVRANWLAAIPQLHERLARETTFPVQQALLRALARLPDARTTRALTASLQSDNIALCCAAIRTYAALIQRGLTQRVGPLSHLLSHHDARVRQTALWALPHTSLWWLRSRLRHLLCHDPAPAARCGALRVLTRRWHHTLFALLCTRLVRDPDRTVRLHIAHAIQQAPAAIQRRHGAALLRSTAVPEQIKSQVLSLLIPQQPTLFHDGTLALEVLRSTSDPQARWHAIDALAGIPTQPIWTALHERIVGHDLESYTAVRALAQHPLTYSRDHLPALLDQLWPTPVLLQALLKIAYSRARHTTWPDACQERLVAALSYPNTNVQYLAALLLSAQQPAAQRAAAWRQMCAGDDTQRALFAPALHRWLRASLITAPASIHTLCTEPALFRAAIAACGALALTPPHATAVLTQLLAPNMQTVDPDYRIRAPLCAHWLAHNVIALTPLLAALPTDAARSALCQQIGAIWQQQPPQPAPQPDTLAHDYHHAEPALRTALLTLLACGTATDIVPQALPLLTSVDATVRSGTRTALAQWCTREARHD